MSEIVHTLAGKKIGIFGKGGAGKSTVTVLLAQALQERGYEVYILDADATNIGLHQALGIDRPPCAPYRLLWGDNLSWGNSQLSG